LIYRGDATFLPPSLPSFHMRAGDWGFSKEVYVLLLILLPLHLLFEVFLTGFVLSQGILYLYWISILTTGVLTGFKARSSLAAVASILVIIATLTLIFQLLLPLLHTGSRTLRPTLSGQALAIANIALAILQVLGLGVLAGLASRCLWRRHAKVLSGV